MRAATRPALSPPPRAEPRSSLAGIMLCVMLGPFVNILDYNVVNVSLPKMMSGLATDVLTHSLGGDVFFDFHCGDHAVARLDWPRAGQ